MARERQRPIFTQIQAKGCRLVDVSSADVDFVAASQRVVRLVVGTAGDLEIVDWAENTVRIPSAAISAFPVVDLHIRKVLNANTTASAIVAYYF